MALHLDWLKLAHTTKFQFCVTQRIDGKINGHRQGKHHCQQGNSCNRKYRKTSSASCLLTGFELPGFCLAVPLFHSNGLPSVGGSLEIRSSS